MESGEGIESPFPTTSAYYAKRPWNPEKELKDFLFFLFRPHPPTVESGEGIESNPVSCYRHIQQLVESGEGIERWSLHRHRGRKASPRVESGEGIERKTLEPHQAGC